MPGKQDSVEARARAYYAFQDLPMTEIVCAGEKSVPDEPPDEYYLSIGGVGQEEIIRHWLSKRLWSQRLVIGQLVLTVLAALGFGEIFDLTSCGDSCPKWKNIGFFASLALFLISLGGSIISACTVRLAQSKLDQIHHEYMDQRSENSISVSSKDVSVGRSGRNCGLAGKSFV